ncbi:MAG: NAD(P)/FAD-dependent oxidoreductase [Nakamurella sp.]
MTSSADAQPTTTEFDLIVIGAGPVGENVADRAVQGGLTAAVVEAELVGGECSYWACMPSKTLLRPGSLLREVQALSSTAGLVAGKLDVRAVLQARDAMTSHWKDDGQVKWLDSAGISLVRGHARLAGPKKVEVTAPDGTVSTLTARHAVAVSTGTTAIVPPIPGLDDVKPWTSREATSATEVPGRLAVIGGGVVAAEMATAWSDLGSEVTMLVRGDSFLGGVEPIAAERVLKAMRGRGITVTMNVSAKSAARRNGVAVLELDNGQQLIADEVLVATGRAPATSDLGLASVGLKDGDWLTVDDTMLVQDVEGGWLYAVGDVNHRVLLTHQGKYQARASGDVIAARAKGTAVDDQPWGTHVATADHAAVPQVVFTDPEVAAVGLTEAQARKAGHSVRVVDVELSSVAAASVQSDHFDGAARLVVDTEREVLLGVTFVGPGVAELIHAATIAVVGGVPISRLWHAVPSYPTLSEIWLRLLEAWGRPAR